MRIIPRPFLALATLTFVLSTTGFAFAQQAPSVPANYSPGDWNDIRAAFNAGRHAAKPAGDGYQFHNPGQQWSTLLDGRGFVVKPQAGDWSWGLQLHSYGVAGNERPVAKTTNPHANGQMIQYAWDSHLTEWYKNDARGLEHGFTVHRRPSDQAGLLTFTLRVQGDLRPEIQHGGRDVRFVNTKNESVVNYSGLTVFDADGKTLPAHFETTLGNLILSVDDRGARYPLTIDPVAQKAYLKASNTGAGDQFGWTVAVSGSTVVIGAPAEDSSATGVNGTQSDNSSIDSGAAYVFVKSAGVWSQQAYLKASNTDTLDQFGRTVAISGDTIVVGAPFEDSSATGVNGDGSLNSASNAGAAYIFVRSGGTWTQQAYLKASNTDPLDEFGWAVSVSGDTVVVTAHKEDGADVDAGGDDTSNSATDAGAVYVFDRSGSTWTQTEYLKASNTEAFDNFGESVSIALDTIVVGAHMEDSNATGVNGDGSNNLTGTSGAAYVFFRSGGVWTPQAYLKASNPDTVDQFGFSVSVSGDTIVAGAFAEDSSSTGVNGIETNNSAVNAGAAYVFFRVGTTWSQQAYLKPFNTGSSDNFGFSVSVSGDAIVVSSHLEDSSTTGINGPSNNSLSGSGAAFAFTRSGTTWTQQAFIKASNTGGLDLFGLSVAISGDLVAVGAWREDSSATGVDGLQSNNDFADAGAAYLFDLDNNYGLSSYGTGTPGCSGTHTLDSTEAPILNSPAFAITCDNAPPLSIGLGIVTDSQDLPGSDAFGVGVLIHSDFIFATELLTFDFFSDATGYSETVGTSIPNTPALIGSTFYACALWAWSPSTCVLPGFNPLNLSTSKGLAITILAP
ncbi:MAG: FG-GAP repeat protein [Planctomycetota bacterium]